MLLNSNLLNKKKIIGDFKNKNFFLINNLLEENVNNFLNLKLIKFPSFFYIDKFNLYFFTDLNKDLQFLLDNYNENNIIFIYYKNMFLYNENYFDFLNQLLNSKWFIFNYFFYIVLNIIFVLKLFLFKIIFFLKKF